MTDTVLPRYADATTLTKLEQRQAPRETGIYAAWLGTRKASQDAGISGHLPRVMYVGIAVRTPGGLRARLSLHADIPFMELNEMLAMRGVVLPAWGYRNARSGDRTPLMSLAMRETRDT